MTVTILDPRTGVPVTITVPDRPDAPHGRPACPAGTDGAPARRTGVLLAVRSMFGLRRGPAA